MSLIMSRSAVVVNEYPRSVIILCKNITISCSPNGNMTTDAGLIYPSITGAIMVVDMFPSTIIPV